MEIGGTLKNYLIILDDNSKDEYKANKPIPNDYNPNKGIDAKDRE